MRMTLLLSFAYLCTSLSICHAQTILGLTTDNKIIGFDSFAPSQIVRGPLDITGLPTGYDIIGMDVRPSTGELYALAFNILTNMARVFVIDYNTGEATPVGSTDIQLPLGEGHAAFDFNPVVDRIRVVGLNRTNYRLNPITGTIASTDTDIDYATGDVNQGVVPAVGAVAYTNSYLATEITTLYVFDQDLNVIATQNPPNAGILNTVGPTTVTFEQSQNRADMDIYFDPVTRANIAYLVTRDTGEASDGLYLVDLSAGGTTFLGQVPADIKDIAVLIERPPIEPLTGVLIYLLTNTSYRLLTIDSDNPSVIRSMTAITGVRSGYFIVGLDVRPADLKLYALGYNRSTNAYQLYTIEPQTGLATPIGDTTQTMVLGTGDVAFDFNPLVDHIRVISASTRNNYRVNPESGALVATDAIVAYASTDPNALIVPQIGSAAYSNNYSGATLSTLFAVDDSVGSIVTINPPNTGTIYTIAGNAFVPMVSDKSSDIDVYYDSTDQSNLGFLVVNVSPSFNDDLYRVDETGQAERVGPIGLGVQIIDIAVQLTYKGDTTTSVASEAITQSTLRISPNPVNEGATLYFTPRDGYTIVRVTDMTGREVYRSGLDASLGRAFVPMSNLPSGVYAVHLHGANDIQSAQVVIL